MAMWADTIYWIITIGSSAAPKNQPTDQWIGNTSKYYYCNRWDFHILTAPVSLRTDYSLMLSRQLHEKLVLDAWYKCLEKLVKSARK